MKTSMLTAITLVSVLISTAGHAEVSTPRHETAGNGFLQVGIINPGFTATPDQEYFERLVTPEYPRWERQHKREGEVLIEYTINPEGNAENIRVLDAKGSRFVQEAVRALKDSSFKPLIIGGRAIAVSGHQMRYRFVIDD